MGSLSVFIFDRAGAHPGAVSKPGAGHCAPPADLYWSDSHCSCLIVQVLILAPFRSRALAIVRRLWSLAQAETRSDSIQHKDRFLDEFGANDDDEVDADDTGGSVQDDRIAEKRLARYEASKAGVGFRVKAARVTSRLTLL